MKTSFLIAAFAVFCAVINAFAIENLSSSQIVNREKRSPPSRNVSNDQEYVDEEEGGDYDDDTYDESAAADETGGEGVDKEKLQNIKDDGDQKVEKPGSPDELVDGNGKDAEPLKREDETKTNKNVEEAEDQINQEPEAENGAEVQELPGNDEDISSDTVNTPEADSVKDRAQINKTESEVQEKPKEEIARAETDASNDEPQAEVETQDDTSSPSDEPDEEYDYESEADENQKQDEKLLEKEPTVDKVRQNEKLPKPNREAVSKAPGTLTVPVKPVAPRSPTQQATKPIKKPNTSPIRRSASAPKPTRNRPQVSIPQRKPIRLSQSQRKPVQRRPASNKRPVNRVVRKPAVTQRRTAKVVKRKR